MELTDREQRILNLLADGMTKGVIQASLSISKVTLEKDLAVLRAKFNAFNNMNLVYLAAKEEVI